MDGRRHIATLMTRMGIPYIPIVRGFNYLAAVMDWASRKVLSWRVSTTMDSGFCLEAVEEAIACYGCPEIFNTDQGSPPSPHLRPRAQTRDRGIVRVLEHAPVPSSVGLAEQPLEVGLCRQPEWRHYTDQQVASIGLGPVACQSDAEVGGGPITCLCSTSPEKGNSYECRNGRLYRPSGHS